MRRVGVLREVAGDRTHKRSSTFFPGAENTCSLTGLNSFLIRLMHVAMTFLSGGSASTSCSEEASAAPNLLSMLGDFEAEAPQNKPSPASMR